MRRWTITFVLGIAAVGAIVLAPRLLGKVHVQPPTQAVIISEVVPQVVPEVTKIVETPPVVDSPAFSLPIAAPIAEVGKKVVPVVQPKPAKLDDFWMDMVDCGMG